LPFFTAQLAILLETGTPVAPSLSAIEQQVACPHWRALVGQLRRHVEEGGTLASAAALYPQVFDAVYVSMIAAGESSGNLEHLLQRLSRLARQADRVRSKVISAMIYPTLLTSIALIVINVLIFFVLPRFALVFEEMKVSLPATTRTLLALSATVRHHLLVCLLAAGAALTGLIFWLRSPPGRRFVARSILKVPLIGPLLMSLINARIFRLLGLLLESSVPLIEALHLTISSTRHYLYAALLQRVHHHVLNGQSMYEALRGSRLVPASLAEMVHTGEQNGQVGRVMTMLADYLDDHNETRVGTLTSVMEPLILIFMGLVIGTVAISLVLPMFDLSRISS
jgi:type II secretory pathway component PulF